MLNTIFVDTLDMDLERLQRVNRTVACIPEAARRQQDGLRVVGTFVVRPSRPLDEMAAAYADELPRAMRLLMRRAGVFAPGGAQVLSYLLFERGYCRDLMRLGFSDAMLQRRSILKFLGYGPVLEGARHQRRATA
jgi:NTE family protein